MKIDKKIFFDALDYISQIEYTSLLDLDFSDLFDDGIDLTSKEKDEYFWGCERYGSNIKIIQKILEDKKANV